MSEGKMRKLSASDYKPAVVSFLRNALADIFGTLKESAKKKPITLSSAMNMVDDILESLFVDGTFYTVEVGSETRKLEIRTVRGAEKTVDTDTLFITKKEVRDEIETYLRAEISRYKRIGSGDGKAMNVQELDDSFDAAMKAKKSFADVLFENAVAILVNDEGAVAATSSRKETEKRDKARNDFMMSCKAQVDNLIDVQQGKFGGLIYVALDHELPGILNQHPSPEVRLRLRDYFRKSFIPKMEWILERPLTDELKKTAKEYVGGLLREMYPLL